MPYGHRVGTNKIRTDPPIVAVHTNFFFSSAVCVVFVRQLVHLAIHFLRATSVKHVLAELLITDEPVVNTQEISLLHFFFLS